MNLTLYQPGNSPLHRMPAGAKLATLFAIGIAVLLTDDPSHLAIGLALVLTGFPAARLPLKPVLRQAVPLFAVLALFFAAHAVFTSVETGTLLALRFATIVAAGLLLTLTTTVSGMMAVLEKGLGPLAVFGFNPAKISLVFALTIRFIPVLADTWMSVRAAQQARGLGGNPLALLIPVTIQTLRRADRIAEAIEARGIDL
ncbi:energy-coupling factor transporter transmembrane protein EcfT [Nisaea acidiphila]|uniref:Energy-coupling factor transporter transmembrane protein EcfT n=1 Tax=Nisaea acidiphila TaxID=1862145 RepID=A0A9J7AQC5_9PROT|nr:energy-coupling factor transporter transmembrane protein EcfT [Nisaea acidiphila]UUX48564.1 energy-coupling factor transporter transmembrane protein EcfT [Nisaea acidiphila]